MGNCLRHESSMQWGGDDWGDDAMQEKVNMGIEEEGLLGGLASSSSRTERKTVSNTEVKIKITKKQLEELLGGVDMKELSVQQVLAQLINVSDQCAAHQRSWRPNLQSIPE